MFFWDSFVRSSYLFIIYHYLFIISEFQNPNFQNETMCQTFLVKWILFAWE